MSSFRADIHRLQLELYAANQKLINDAVEGYTPEFRRYEARYRRTVAAVRRPVSLERLTARTRKAKVVLVGDYHTLRQAQRSFFRLLRRQPDSDRRVTLALEMLPAGHQPSIDRFVSGALDEERFLRRIDHLKRWPFGRLDSMEAVFALARRRGWRVIGLDPDEPHGWSLADRDRFAAQRIREALVLRPEDRVFVLIGEMHLAPAHLPRAMSAELGDAGIDGSVLRVHQNPERIWFEQSAQAVAHEHELLELEDGAYALLSAPPVVCQQSFLTWLEEAQEGEEHAFPDADAGERRFRQSVQLIGRALSLPAHRALREVEVVGPADLSFFARLARSKQFSKKELAQIRAHILSSESCYIPRLRLVYLATTSLNHAAEEAAHFLRHHCSTEGLDDPKSPLDAFYARVMNEAVGFLGSKIVNPKRKCVREEELELLVDPQRRALHTTPRTVAALDLDAARAVLAHKRMERGQHQPHLSRVFHAPAAQFNAVTHVLGYMLGERLYYALLRGKLSRSEARELFFEPFEEEGAALLLYLELATRMQKVRPPKRA